MFSTLSLNKSDLKIYQTARFILFCLINSKVVNNRQRNENLFYVWGTWNFSVRVRRCYTATRISVVSAIYSQTRDYSTGKFGRLFWSLRKWPASYVSFFLLASFRQELGHETRLFAKFLFMPFSRIWTRKLRQSQMDRLKYVSDSRLIFSNSIQWLSVVV